MDSIGASVERLELAAVVKASHAVSEEIELDRLIETLMKIVLEHAGAERGLLVLFPGDEPRIAAEATTSRGTVAVTLRRTAAVTPAELPESVLRYAMRTRQSVILDDAAASTGFSADAYVRERRPRSVLCLPLVKRTKLVGALYLENFLTPRAFTSDRIAVLELLGSQAAISLKNAILFSDLQRENAERTRAEEELRHSQTFLAEGQRLSHSGSWAWNASTRQLVCSEEAFRILGYDPSVSATLEMAFERIHPEDLHLAQEATDLAAREARGFDIEHRLLMPDGSVKHVHVVARAVRNEADQVEVIGALVDVTAAKRAEEELRKAHAALAHVTRVTALGELAASLAHEVNQPLTAIVSNAEACRRWLDRSVPDLGEARGAVERIIANGHRAGEVTRRVRALLHKGDTERTALYLNEVVNEAVALVRHEALSQRVALRVELAPALPPVDADRVQLQQVIVNLAINGIEAMQTVTDRPRELAIRSYRDDARNVLIAVEDSGTGIAAGDAERLFEAFFTTKSSGMGMGLAICRSIVEAHGGRLWGCNNAGAGATFHFALPPYRAEPS